MRILKLLTAWTPFVPYLSTGPYPIGVVSYEVRLSDAGLAVSLSSPGGDPVGESFPASAALSGTPLEALLSTPDVEVTL